MPYTMPTTSSTKIPPKQIHNKRPLNLSSRTDPHTPHITTPNGIQAVPENEALQWLVSRQSAKPRTIPYEVEPVPFSPGPRSPASTLPSSLAATLAAAVGPPFVATGLRGWSVMWSMTHIHPWVVSHSTSGVALSIFKKTPCSHTPHSL